MTKLHSSTSSLPLKLKMNMLYKTGGKTNTSGAEKYEEMCVSATAQS